MTTNDQHTYAELWLNAEKTFAQAREDIAGNLVKNPAGLATLLLHDVPILIIDLAAMEKTHRLSTAQEAALSLINAMATRVVTPAIGERDLCCVRAADKILQMLKARYDQTLDADGLPAQTPQAKFTRLSGVVNQLPQLYKVFAEYLINKERLPSRTWENLGDTLCQRFRGESFLGAVERTLSNPTSPDAELTISDIRRLHDVCDMLLDRFCNINEVIA